MKVDLHVHTNLSDSSKSIEETLEIAKEKGVEVLSLVDHDTTETYEKAKDLAQAYGIQLIPGVEISSYDYQGKRKVHLLAYKYGDQTPNMDKINQETLRRRNEKSLKQLKILQEEGYLKEGQEVGRSKNKAQTLYKQHLMAAMTQADYYSQEYQDLYRSLFKNQNIAHIEMEYVDVFQALEAILKDGAIPVLAHPGETDSFELVPELVQKGLRGIEVLHPSHGPEDRKKARELAEKYQLMETAGSDYHGDFGSREEMGVEIQSLNWCK